jgi:hypothetical protein
MSQITINTHRTFVTDVEFTAEDEHGAPLKAKIRAKFRILPQNEIDQFAAANPSAKILDPILVSVEGLSLLDTDGKPLSGEEFLFALKQDPVISSALWLRYREEVRKKSGLAA